MRFNVVAGTEVTVSTMIVDENGAPIDPDTIKLRWQSPAGIDQALSPLRTGEGHYQHSLTVDVAGEWLFEWVTTNPNLVTLPYYLGVLPAIGD